MKMVKSALLLSAAGLVAASGAQAADLPVKAKPVEYVKVCSLYGAGFYYIPGTDICMKIGGYVRWQESWNAGGDISRGPLNGPGGRATRLDDTDFSQRTRTIATFDTRQQTAYGTLRTYVTMGFSSDTTPGAALGIYANRAFIQIAGFTFGLATSFFDFVSTAAVAYNAGMIHSPDTGDTGWMVAGYTAQFGNGVSATIAAEQARSASVVNAGFVPLAYGVLNTNGLGANPTSDRLGGSGSLQDIVGNIRVDQAWGSAQVSAALHHANGGYYGSGTTNSEVLGHPGDKWGWAVSGGLRLNAPMIGPGDYFQGAVVYAEGATRYAAGMSQTGNSPLKFDGNSVGFGFWEDGVYGSLSGVDQSVQLTTAWSVAASYEHFWTPSLRTSVYGSYVNISHNTAAKDMICSSFLDTGSVNGLAAATGCNPDFSMWNIGTRSQWNVTKDLYVGLDVIYLKLNTATFDSSGVVSLPANGPKPRSGIGGPYTVDDQDAWMATWRIHRDIVP